MKKDPVLEALKKASKGLKFTSETEAKLEPFAWKDGDKLTQERLLGLAGAEKDAPVEEMALDSLFHAVPSQDKAQFDKLGQVLTEQLSGVKVYKIGEEAEKEVYILGKTQDGRWAGLKTAVAET